ncbi:MAG: SpoIIE family protein phosphatase [Bacteroidales bacterium]|nr:SpoIIE family protein phosphatase [Bacteroidales bacterium]
MRRSLSARLSLWIVLVAALLLLGMIISLSRVWRTGVRAEVDKDAAQVLDNAVLRLDDILDDVERTASVLYRFVIRDLDKPDMMVSHSNNTIRYNSALSGCSISFEPGYYPSKGEYYSIYSWPGENDQIEWEQEGADDYRYYEKEWYLYSKRLGYDCWTEPYLDTTGIAGKGVEMLISYCTPVFDSTSVFVGAITLDLSLKQLSEALYNVRPYPNAYCILIGEGGKYLVHPDSDKLMTHSIYSDAEELAVPELVKLGESMEKQERGEQELFLNGQHYYVFYRPVPTTGWNIAIFCPESDIYGGYDRLQRKILWSLLAGLALVFLLSVLLIRHQLAPLAKLAEEADYIASGNFDRPMPVRKRNDEIGVLSQSFVHMQSSLVRHIQELTESTASRERMERELQIARNIQMGMVPHDFDLGKKVDLYASMVPAREVGGDLYDCFVQDDKLYLCIGDVSGKGVPASLFMSVARAMFRVVARQGLAPAEIARRINDTVSEKNDQMIFVTMFLAAVDLKTGVMEYCNCGHNAPVLFPGPDKAPAFLDCLSNTALGIESGFDYEGQRVDDMRGKILFLYTDGLNEAENADHEQFGNDRMLACLGDGPFLDARSLIDRLSEAVASHVAGAEASDDLTMLCLRIHR